MIDGHRIDRAGMSPEGAKQRILRLVPVGSALPHVGRAVGAAGHNPFAVCRNGTTGYWVVMLFEGPQNLAGGHIPQAGCFVGTASQ